MNAVQRSIEQQALSHRLFFFIITIIMKGPPLPLKAFISFVLIVAALIFVLQAHRDVAITSDSASTHPVEEQDHSAINRSDSITPLTTSRASQQRHLSNKSSNIGERELLDNTKTHSLLRRADPPLLPSRRSDDIRSERGGCSRVLVVFVEQIISQL